MAITWRFKTKTKTKTKSHRKTIITLTSTSTCLEQSCHTTCKKKTVAKKVTKQSPAGKPRSTHAILTDISMILRNARKKNPTHEDIPVALKREMDAAVNDLSFREYVALRVNLPTYGMYTDKIVGPVLLGKQEMKFEQHRREEEEKKQKAVIAYKQNIAKRETQLAPYMLTLYEDLPEDLKKIHKAKTFNKLTKESKLTPHVHSDYRSLPASLQRLYTQYEFNRFVNDYEEKKSTQEMEDLSMYTLGCDELLDKIKLRHSKIFDESTNVIRTDIYKVKDNYNAIYGYAVPTEEAIDHITEFVGEDEVIEVGAGKGLWAKLLKCKGVDIIATDDFSTHQDVLHAETFTDIEDLSAKQAVRKYGSHNVLMMVWPAPGHLSSMASDALKSFTGNKIVYVGELSPEGCTGDVECNTELTYGTEWTKVAEIDIPRFRGAFDNVTLLSRN